MKFDDASWHYGGNFPSTSPKEYGGTHIGLFLKWCFIKGWAGGLHLEEHAQKVEAVSAGAMSGTDFLFDCCDGKLTDEDLSPEGTGFAKRYYGENGLYLQDYAAKFEQLMYVEPESAHDFRKFSKMLQARLESGALTTEDPVATKPWWKFW